MGSNTMKLVNAGSIFNMGDTSVRVREVVEVNRLILQTLATFITQIPKWEGNTSAQAEFYKLFISEVKALEQQSGVTLFKNISRNLTDNDLDKRGRTLTNAIVKTGLIDDKRNISNVAKAYLNEKINPDSLEVLLGLSQDNLLYFRQYMKLRIYDSESDKYFYCFRFALKFLCRYKDVPKKDFFYILESIRPKVSEEKLNKIIDGYQAVVNGNMTFDLYWQEFFYPDFIDVRETQFVKEMFESKDYSEENFIRAFPNRKSKEASLEYREFILTIFELLEHKSEEALIKLKDLSKKDKIKKAFGFGQIPFKFNRHKESVKSFFENNSDNKLLLGNYHEIYIQFMLSKISDLIREYSDMCYRYFNVTGLINFSNNLVNLNFGYIIKPLIENLAENFILIGDSPYEEYELNLDSQWFSNISLSEILQLNEDELINIKSDIRSQLGIASNDLDSNLNFIVEQQREKEYREFIESEFPISTVIDILEHIKNREDSEVAKLVTEEATISTIYEYILTIAWYHLSENKDFEVHKTFGVSLDGNKLPLVHKGGGSGDIEVITNSNATLIEVTLMERNTQKRGELEPVIRHSVNFALQHSEIPVQTIFIANELDSNVINIFRGVKNIELNGTLSEGTCLGLNIFALTTDELIQLLDRRISVETILFVINQFNEHDTSIIKNNWREPIVNRLLS